MEEGLPDTLLQATEPAEPALVAYFTDFAESAVLSTLPRPTSALEYEGLVAAFAHAETSDAGIEVGKSVISALTCL